MDKLPTHYRTINCSYYDQLEAYATLRTMCDIFFNDGAGERNERGIIADIFARDGAEYLRLNSGIEIRLDHLISINGQPVGTAC